MLGNLRSLEKPNEVVPGGVLANIIRAFPLENGKLILGDQEFTLDEVKNGTFISQGSMHTVIILPKRRLVLKFNKPSIIGDTYLDKQLQIAAFRTVKEENPELEFHFPEAQVISSEHVQGTYAVVSEQIIGRTMMISDIYNKALHSQIRDLRKVFYLLLSNHRMPICLDLMGAKEGIKCALYGLELIDDFPVANIIITNDNIMNIIDEGNSFSTCNNLLKNLVNTLPVGGQIMSMEHMYAMACGKKESFIR